MYFLLSSLKWMFQHADLKRIFSFYKLSRCSNRSMYFSWIMHLHQNFCGKFDIFCCFCCLTFNIRSTHFKTQTTHCLAILLKWDTPGAFESVQSTHGTKQNTILGGSKYFSLEYFASFLKLKAGSKAAIEQVQFFLNKTLCNFRAAFLHDRRIDWNMTIIVQSASTEKTSVGQKFKWNTITETWSLIIVDRKNENK